MTNPPPRRIWIINGIQSSETESTRFFGGLVGLYVAESEDEALRKAREEFQSLLGVSARIEKLWATDATDRIRETLEEIEEKETTT